MEKHIGDFMRIVRCTNYFRTQKMADSGITGIQCTYLLCINRTPGISQEQLASQLYKDKSVIARHLASLESNGYIHRKPDSKDPAGPKTISDRQSRGAASQNQRGLPGMEPDFI